MFDDSTVKNKFRWPWMDKEVEGELVERWCRKTLTPGICVCVLCSDSPINYGSTGFRSLEQHARSAKHKDKLKSIACCSVSGGETLTTSNQTVSVYDRKTNMEAMLLTFLAENRLPNSLCENLVAFLKEAVKDPAAVQQMSVSASAASYKIAIGLKTYWENQLAEILRSSQFSLTVDESTSANNKRVLALLVNYFSESEGKVLCEHLRCVQLEAVDAESIENAIMNVLGELDIPLSNLVSIHSDSCNVMRGIHNGVCTRLRRRIPSLIDTGGDVCHTLHNASSKLTRHFDERIESLLDHLHVDRQEGSVNQAIEAIGAIIGVTVRSQKRRLSHRWLSSLPLVEQLLKELDVLTLFYSAFFDGVNKNSIIHGIFKRLGVLPAGQNEILEIVKDAKTKTSTKMNSKAGSAMNSRRSEIVKGLFTLRRETLLLLQYYRQIYRILDEYLKLFQSSKPMMHVVLPSLRLLVRRLSIYFVKGRKIDEVDQDSIGNAENHIKTEKVFSDLQAAKRFGKNDDRLRSLQEKALKGLVSCVQYLMKKLPFSCDSLNAFQGLNPENRKLDRTSTELDTLVDLLAPIALLGEDEINQAKAEARHYICLEDVPLKSEPNGEQMAIDRWWNLVLALRNTATNLPAFPCLGRIVRAALTCFTGPSIEGVFTAMNVTQTKSRPNLEIDGISASITAQYREKVYGDCVKQFRLQDPKRTPIQKQLLSNIRKAWKIRVEDQRRERERKATAVKLNDAARAKLEAAAEQRRKVIQERRLSLKILSKTLNDRRRQLHNLPRIKRKRADCAEAESVSSDTAEASDPVNQNLPSFTEGPPKTKKMKQSDISSFFQR